ncbi:hypothetical protein Clacol_007180 [Clathrus columnatus]|uniref:MFS general substrate transporter n=1 Tax=Clathrus columnatus TaxID=1419009 RepID=A0AAV5AHG2_9AGAM|nr:hypothetical protein Clacol_007180 [Clathrus columnatus]
MSEDGYDIKSTSGKTLKELDENLNDDPIRNAKLRGKAEKELKWKLDIRLVPTIALIFIMNCIDRTAVTAARLQGLEADLGLSDIQYDAVVAIVYVNYCVMQAPSNMFLNRVTKPSWYIGWFVPPPEIARSYNLYSGICVILWGITSALTGITHNYAGIMACRIFIGLPEAAFYPGAIYLLSRWYTRKELALRSAGLYCGLLISNAFGSLMAAGILSNMNGKRGIAAWRWLFFIEGSITVVIGIMTIFVLPDYPHNTRWLSPEESRLAQVRLAEEAGEADSDGSEDSLAATLGFDTTDTLLIAATGERFFHMTGWWWVTIVGYIIGLSTSAVGGRYVSMFLMTPGYAGVAMNMVIPRPPAKRAAAIGLTNGFGNLGNLIGSFIWRAQWGPSYHQSMIISICTLSFASVLSLVMRQILVYENKALDAQDLLILKGSGRERVEEFARLEGISFDEAVQRKKGFRYLY